jgi:ParB-like chromosome segregation protein Spo0J
MAVKLDVQYYRRSDYHFCNPLSIVYDDSKNGRAFPIDDDSIVAMAESMLVQGQLQPIKCRKTPDGQVEAVLGFTRLKAARLIRQGYTIPGEGGSVVERINPEFKIQFTLTSCNEQEALLQNIEENRARNATSPIDDAHNHRRLREQYGYKDVEIARLYKCSPSRVSQLSKLLTLDERTQRLVHSGALPLIGALDLVGLGEQDRAKVIERVKPEDTESIKAADVRRAVREVQESREVEEATTKTQPEENTAQSQPAQSESPDTQPEAAAPTSQPESNRAPAMQTKLRLHRAKRER